MARPAESHVTVSRLTTYIATAAASRLWFLRSRQWQRATTRQLDTIIHQQRLIMDGHQAITLAVNNAVTGIQAAVDEIAAHATANDDDDLNALASRLQGAVSMLSTAATRHGVEVPATGTAAPGTDTISGAGGQGTATTNDTVQGAGSLTQEGRATFPSGQPAQGDQTGVDVTGNDTVSGTAGGNDTIAGTDSTTSRRR
jgi:hypothetical protein